MDSSNTFISVLITLLIFTSFVKIATVLSICRYGLGLLGFEFGAVCLVVSLGLSIFMCPPELTALGFPEVLLSRSQSIQPQAVTEALVPFMERRLDPGIQRYLGKTKPSEPEKLGDAERNSGSKPAAPELRVLVPAYLLSELKAAFHVGCLLLIPFVLIDLVSAHLLALLGVQQLGAHAVALPLKILVFISAGGWGLLGKRVLGLE